MAHEIRRLPTFLPPISDRLDTAAPVFFFNDPATTEIYTLSLHDALPIYRAIEDRHRVPLHRRHAPAQRARDLRDRKSTRLNSSHTVISYAVFCLKKKNGRLAGSDPARGVTHPWASTSHPRSSMAEAGV